MALVIPWLTLCSNVLIVRLQVSGKLIKLNEYIIKQYFLDAQWASLNHGVLICDECCLAHRSLGRCISIIKSLRKSYWPQSLIDVNSFIKNIINLLCLWKIFFNRHCMNWLEAIQTIFGNQIWTIIILEMVL